MRKPSLTTIRIILVIAAPFVFVWAFLATLAAEMCSACWFAWNAVQQEVETFSDYWRHGIPDRTRTGK